MLSELDRVNQRVYAGRGARRQYGRAEGWLDGGERAAVACGLRTLVRPRVLDIGVGGGRTAPLLSALAGSYTGIDYTPDLITAARRRFPTLDLRQMDARQLDFADNSFDFVVFSYNGIDSVDLAGRMQALREINRVLAPDGVFVFSSLNRHGSAYGETPWLGDQRWRGLPGLLRRARRIAIGSWNGRRHRSLCQDGGEIALASISVHDFGLVTMFTSAAAQRAQLRETGFAVDFVLHPDTGREISAEADRTVPWFYYVAHRTSDAPVAVVEPLAPTLAARQPVLPPTPVSALATAPS